MESRRTLLLIADIHAPRLPHRAAACGDQPVPLRLLRSGGQPEAEVRRAHRRGRHPDHQGEAQPRRDRRRPRPSPAERTPFRSPNTSSSRRSSTGLVRPRCPISCRRSRRTSRESDPFARTTWTSSTSRAQSLCRRILPGSAASAGQLASRAAACRTCWACSARVAPLPSRAEIANHSLAVVVRLATPSRREVDVGRAGV